MPDASAAGERDGAGQPGDTGRRQIAGEPDVHLDVSKLGIQQIQLEVENLDANVSLRARLADLLELNVGVQARLARVHLDIRGVDAAAMLKVRLHVVQEILARALDSIDRNPQIIERVTGATGQVIGSPDGPGQAVQQLTAGAQRAATRRPAVQALRHAWRDRGARGLFRRAADQVGNGARHALYHLGEAGMQRAARRVAGAAKLTRIGRGHERRRAAREVGAKQPGRLRGRLFRRR